MIYIIMLKFKKICIDSSYKVSGTSSDFASDLPETVQLEDNMLCQIHEVSIPHSWYSIQKGVNDRIFVRVEHTGTGPWTTRAMITLPEGDYSVQIIPGSDILTHPEWFPDVNVNSLRSVNKVLQNYIVATYDFNTSHYSGFIDLQRVKSLYLRCNEISNYNQLTVAGNSSIIKKLMYQSLI